MIIMPKRKKKTYYLRQLSFVARDADAVVSKLPVFGLT